MAAVTGNPWLGGGFGVVDIRKILYPVAGPCTPGLHSRFVGGWAGAEMGSPVFNSASILVVLLVLVLLGSNDGSFAEVYEFRPLTDNEARMPGKKVSIYLGTWHPSLVGSRN